MITAMLHWLKTELRDNFTSRSILLTLATVGIAFVCAQILLILFAGPEKYTKVAMLLVLAPIFVFMPHKEKWIMGMFLFATSLGTGQMVLDTMGGTLPPLRHAFLLRLSDILLFTLLGLRLFYIYIEQNGPYSIWQNRVGVIYLLWVVWSLLSLFPAEDNTAAFLGIYEIMIRSFITFFVVFHFMQRREDLHLIMLGLFATLMFQTLLIIAQQATQSIVILLPGLDDELDSVDGIGFRPSGTMGHSSNYAKLTGEVLPIALAYAFFAPGIARLPALVTWAMGLAALALTVSRAGLGSWLITSALFPFGLLFLRIVHIRPMIPLFSVFFLVLLVGVGVIAATAGDKIASRIEDDGGSADTRPPMWAVARNIISQNPILGIGYKNYMAVHQKYDNTEEQISIVLPLPVHNLYLLFAAELGIPGLLLFLALLLITMWNCLRCAMAPELNTLERSVYLSMILAIITILLQGHPGKGFIDNLVHMSVVAVYAACSAKQWIFIQEIREQQRQQGELQ